LPVTDTLYPVLSFRTARPVAPGTVGVQVVAGTATMMEGSPEEGVIQLTECYQAPVVQGGVLVGLVPRVDLAGEFLYGFGWSSGSPGLRLSSRIRLTNRAAPVIVSLAPALVTTWAWDSGEDDFHEPKPQEKMRSQLNAAELRIPLTVPVSGLADFTVAAGVTAARYRASFHGYQDNSPELIAESYSMTRTEVRPLFTAGFRVGVFTIEAGAHKVGAHWESAAGIALGWQ
jgi:hypothetical protein